MAASGVRPTFCTARATATSSRLSRRATSPVSRDALGDVDVQIADAVSAAPAPAAAIASETRATRPGAESAEHPNHLGRTWTVIDHLQPTTGVLNEREHWPGRTMMRPAFH